MNFRITILFVLLTTCFTGVSQTISGKVITEENDSSAAITGALLRIESTNNGTFSEEDGLFTLQVDDRELPLTVITSYVGYTQDTTLLKTPDENVTIRLVPEGALEGVVVESEEKATQVNALAAQQVEVLGEKELLKAACCNLSESFENSATVDVNYNDAVSGSKQISLLGLNGVYSQINWENMPLVRGLGEYYGLSFVPGTWIESIQVGKGAGSVINGYESMTGQINVEFRKPDTMDEFYLNGYQNAQGRSELNSHFGTQLNKQWSTGVFLHGNMVNGENDGNADGFNDRNKGGQVNIFNRWKYVGKENLRSQFGGRYVYDKKIGGQLGFSGIGNEPEANIYGVDVESNRAEFFAKNGLIFPEKPWKSVGFIVNGTFHNQHALFGRNELESKQQSLYSNLIYQTILGNTSHILKTGGNLQYDHFEEQFTGNRSEREFMIPGVFAEYEYDNLQNLKVVAGIRGDYVNTTQDIEVSPRIHVKLNTNDADNSLRVSAGRGFRAPNLYADSPNLLVSSREIILQEQPQLESSWNYGASLTRYFSFGGREGTFSTDFYRTSFKNQIIRDMYSSQNAVYISNLDGKSYANSLQATVDYELAERLDVRMAFKHDDVHQEINGQQTEKQLTPEYRGLFNVAYALPFDRWVFDATAQYVGRQRLPSTAIHPNGLTNPHYSPDYIKLSGQITTRIKQWEIYAGGENLGNFKQQNPIIGAENPFGNDFDASSVWGPVQGRNIYAGFRYILKNKNTK